MPDATPLLLVMVGTDYHPFTRMVDWADRWFAAQPEGSVRCLIQYGETRPPRSAPGKDYWPRTQLDDLMRQASVVVCHGGPSTIVETRRQGLMPIVLPRSHAWGEHVDNHQRRFAAAMARRGMIHLVDDEAGLHAAMSTAVHDPLRIDGNDQASDPSVAAARLGRLVDNLVARRCRRGAHPAT